jgi:hypothetical protein
MTKLWRECGWPGDNNWAIEFGDVTVYVSGHYAEITVGRNSHTKTPIEPAGDTMDARKANALILATDAIQNGYLRMQEELHEYRGKAIVCGIKLPGEK